MAITLASVSGESFLMQGLVLALVGIGITVAIYGLVALIVKADDLGVALAKREDRSTIGAMSRVFGRVLVFGMPGFLAFLSAVGTAAMIWVGGGIIVHGLEAYGVHSLGRIIGSAADAAANALPSADEAVKWTMVAFLSGVVGLSIGAVSIPVIEFAIAPALKLFNRGLCKREG
jgi:predicted DNA repair protein MutK